MMINAADQINRLPLEVVSLSDQKFKSYRYTEGLYSDKVARLEGSYELKSRSYHIGFAKIYFKDGRYFRGFLDDDRKAAGLGKLVSKTHTYVGPLLNGLYEGRGTITLADGTKYRGLFRQGRAVNVVRIEDDQAAAAADQIFATQNPRQIPAASIRNHEDVVSLGDQEFKSFHYSYGLYSDKVDRLVGRHYSGYAKINFKDRRYFKGWLDPYNKASGLGKLVGKDFTYIGSFLNGMFHGKGELTYSDGTKCKGDFVKGDLSGAPVEVTYGGRTDREKEYRSKQLHARLDAARDKAFKLECGTIISAGVPGAFVATPFVGIAYASQSKKVARLEAEWEELLVERHDVRFLTLLNTMVGSRRRKMNDRSPTLPDVSHDLPDTPEFPDVSDLLSDTPETPVSDPPETPAGESDAGCGCPCVNSGTEHAGGIGWSDEYRECFQDLTPKQKEVCYQENPGCTIL